MADGLLAFSTFGATNMHEIRQLTGHGLDYLSVEELQALLDQTVREVAPSDLIHIYLPPVTYEGDLKLARAYEFYGCTDEGAGALFSRAR